MSDTEKPQALDEEALAEVAGGVVPPSPVFGGGIPGMCPIFGGAGSTVTIASDGTVVMNPGFGVAWG